MFSPRFSSLASNKNEKKLFRETATGQWEKTRVFVSFHMQPDDFDIENGTVLGCGAIAYVNRVQHRHSGAHFAIKCVSKVQALQQHKTEGLRMEKQALTKLRFHPGVVHLCGTMQSDDEIYFVMENLARGDLAEHIKRVSGLRRMSGGDEKLLQRMPCLCRSDAQSILIQIALALRAVWEAGIVVRDVKPENVAFHSNGRAVLLDFDTAQIDAAPLRRAKQQQQQQLPQRAAATSGATTAGGAEARAEDAASNRKKDDENQKQQQPTSSDGNNNNNNNKIPRISEIQANRRKSTQFCGTAQFVSPEALSACEWTFASDVFALGSLLHFMLAGRPLFDGESAFVVMQKVRQGVEAVRSEDMSSGVRSCEGAESMIRRLLSADPTQRFCRVKQQQQQQVQLGTEQKTEAFTDTEVLEFDIDAFRNHHFFSGAEGMWERFEKEDFEVRQKQMAASASASLALSTIALSEPSPCARATAVTYRDEPRHDDNYADYAMRAGASDVERWWLDVAEKMEQPSAAASASGRRDDDNVDDEDAGGEKNKQHESQNAAGSASSSNNNNNNNASACDHNDEEDDTMHVIDDVGQQHFITSAFGKDGDDQ